MGHSHDTHWERQSAADQLYELDETTTDVPLAAARDGCTQLQQLCQKSPQHCPEGSLWLRESAEVCRVEEEVEVGPGALPDE